MTTTNGCGPKLISIDAAAKLQGTTALNILMQVKRGRLAGEEIDGVWYVTAASLAQATGETRETKGSVACYGNCKGCSDS